VFRLCLRRATWADSGFKRHGNTLESCAASFGRRIFPTCCFGLPFEHFRKHFWDEDHMNTKMIIAALALSLSLAACAKKDATEAAQDAAATAGEAAKDAGAAAGDAAQAAGDAAANAATEAGAAASDAAAGAATAAGDAAAAAGDAAKAAGDAAKDAAKPAN
jgi:hypothetical protein